MDYWSFYLCFPYELIVEDFIENVRLPNVTEIFEAGCQETPGTKWTDFPKAHLLIKNETPIPDCFNLDCFTFISGHMRAAMRGYDEGLQFFDVEVTTEFEPSRPYEFYILNVANTEPYADPEKSETHPGFTIPGNDAPIKLAKRIIQRTGFTAKNHLFCDAHFISKIICSEELAVTLLKANCTGIRFYDPAMVHDLSVARHFRTLRGIEEEGEFNTVTRVENTKLVIPIN